MIYRLLGVTRAFYAFLGIADPEEVLEALTSSGCRLSLRALVSRDSESERLKTLLEVLKRWSPGALEVEYELGAERLLPALALEEPRALAGRLVFYGVPGYTTFPALLQAALEACRQELQASWCPSEPVDLELYVAEGVPSYRSVLTAARLAAACSTVRVRVVHTSALKARGEPVPTTIPLWVVGAREALAGVLDFSEALSRLRLALSRRGEPVEQL